MTNPWQTLLARTTREPAQVSDRQVRLEYNGEKGTRLDRYLASALPEFSRTRLQILIRDGLILLDGQPAGKAGLPLSPGSVIEVRIPPSAPVELVPEDIPLNVLFENDDLMVINKPAGMVVHPAAGHERGTLVHAALARDPDLEGVGGEKRPGIVHRLDKDTSGIILIAKRDPAHRWLQDQFRLRKALKTYLALVDGAPPTPSGLVDAPIGRDVHNRKRMAVVSAEKGRASRSEYLTRETFDDQTLLEVHPFTGRTHQIRLHLAFLGCPVAGDQVYGRRKPTISAGRQFLHAWRLTIQLPGESSPRTFEAPLPAELDAVLEELRSRRRRA